MIKKVLPDILCLFFYFLSAPSLVLGQSSNFEVIQLEQIDLNQDGRPDQTVISTNFYSEKDRILVIDNSGDMQVSQDWTQATDFINDTWVFDARGDNIAELVITFAVENKNSVAYLFFRDGAKSDTFNYASPNAFKLQYQTNWSLKVMAETGWVLENGKPNQNLTFIFPACEDAPSKLRDVNNDSIPDFEVFGLISEPTDCEVEEIPTGMWVNKGVQAPLDDGSRVFWPFLLGSENLDRIKTHNKFIYFPFITVDWENGTLAGTSIGQLSSGYPIESGYFIGSFNNFYENTINKANFENPMAYYDLAGDQDGMPELHIRMAYFNPMDPDLDVSIGERPLNDIRYSWNQYNDPGLVWDYKIALAGLNEVRAVTWFDSFGIQTVPYEALPDWVSQQRWEWGTLVANEGGGAPSSEGIYEWSATNLFQADSGDPDSRVEGSQIEIRQYLAGIADQLPEGIYHQIRTGMRGEFGYLYDQPTLYFSSIDHKLHLSNASYGTWNLGEAYQIQTVNLDQDETLDQWILKSKDRVLKQLNAHSGLLIYQDIEDQIIEIVKTDLSPSLFKVFPPRNHEEWLLLGSLLEENKPQFAPDDFSAMVGQFEGNNGEIRDGKIRDFRLTESGFRFVLQLNEAYTLNGADIFGLQGTSPGDYVVIYDGRFKIQNLTPMDLHVDIEAPHKQHFTALVPSSIPLRIANRGLEDAPDVTLSADMTSPDGKTLQHAEVNLSILAGQQQRVHLPFSPDFPGDWTLQIFFKASDNTSLDPINATSQVFQLSVQPALRSSLWQNITAFGLIQAWQLIALLMILASTALIIVLALFHHPDTLISSAKDFAKNEKGK